MPAKRVDTSRWDAKVKRIRDYYPKDMAALVTLGAFTVGKQIRANLRGTVYRKGQLPVRKVSGRLYGAVCEKRESDMRKHVYMDKNAAPYAVFVHWGTRKLMARKFFTSAFTELKDKTIKLWRTTLKQRIKKYNEGKW